MSKKIIITRKAEKDLNKLPANIKNKITQKIITLSKNPNALVNNITKLVGEKDLYRLRVGNYRVIYTDTLAILYIEKIKPRGKAYN